MKLRYLLGTCILLMTVVADQFLYGNKNFVIDHSNHAEYVCVNIKLSFKQFLYTADLSGGASSKIMTEVISDGHKRFIDRISKIFAELQHNEEAESEQQHGRHKRSVVAVAAAGLGMVATSAIWYFVDNVRNVNAKLFQITSEMEVLKSNQKEMLGFIQTLANTSMETQIRIEEDFGINAILKLMNGGLHPEFLTTSQILETFSNQLSSFVFETLIYNKHASAIFSFAEVAVKRWDSNLEEASLRVCLPAIKEQNLFIAKNIIHAGFFVENNFARFQIPETTIFVNSTQYVYALKNCTMKGLFHLCPSVELTELYPLQKWPLNILNVDQSFVDIKIIDNTYLVATKKTHYYILPKYDTIPVPKTGVFTVTLNHTQSFLIDGVEPLPGLDKVFYVNDRLEETYANMSLELANILVKSKEAEAELINGVLLPHISENTENNIFYIVLVIGLSVVFISLAALVSYCLVIFIYKNVYGKK